jgi:hypothetical protein
MLTDVSDYPYELFSSTCLKESTGLICKKSSTHQKYIRRKWKAWYMQYGCTLCAVGEELNKCFPFVEEEPEDDDEKMGGNRI